MSFWNFIGGFALFNFVWDWFSDFTKRVDARDSCQFTGYDARIRQLDREVMESRKRVKEYHRLLDRQAALDGYDVDDIEDRIDELESQLDECDMMSDRYDRVQDEIDLLEDRLDYLDHDDHDDW